ncbi:MAG: flagellar biosynthetic protein FliO [Janthinobacterium lividum]
MMQVVTGLAVVLALMAGVAWLLKRLNIAKTGSASAIRIIGGVSVGNRERVMVVEVADQWIVVGVAAGSVTSLATMPRQVPTGRNAALGADGLPVSGTDSTPGASTANFSSWLKQKIDQRNART